MAPTITETLSFQPWTKDGSDEGSLKDVLARVNLERGHFRTITEASLQEEIAAEGALELSESGDEDEDEDEDNEENGADEPHGKPTNLSEFYKVKQEMLANIRGAEQEVLLATDFVSLLLSKEQPKQAQTTISPTLKSSVVPLGSLGADIWQRMPVDKVREAQDEMLASNIRMKGLQQGADSLLSAANRLHDNVRKETEYWNQILSITEKGWNVCKIPGQKNRLGVHFGFSESSGEFSRRGIAALHSSTDGTITLDRGIGRKPKALRAVLRRNGEVVGSSKVPNIPDDEETTLEARIRYARDGLFDEELYYEMIRESRSLASLGVGMKGSAIQLGTHGVGDAGIDVSLDLVSLDEDHDDYTKSSHGEDALSQAIILAARLLLSQAHRDRLKKRKEIPPPLSDEKRDDKPILPILRPILAFVMHRSVTDQMNSYVDTVSQMLDVAKIETSHQSGRFELPLKANITSAEHLISVLMEPWTSKAKLTISPPNAESLAFEFKVETTLAYGSGPVFGFTSPSHPQGYRMDTIDELIAASDAKIASALAMATAGQLGEEWKASVSAASLEKKAGDGESRRKLWIRLGSEKKEMTLSSKVDTLSWRVGGDMPMLTFWDGASNLSR